VSRKKKRKFYWQKKITTTGERKTAWSKKQAE